MSQRKKGNQPLDRQHVIDILKAANAVSYDLKNGRIIPLVGPDAVMGEPRELTPQNFFNELIDRLSRAWSIE